MASGSRPLLLAAALAASACSTERELPPPVPTSIEPARAYAHAEVPVVIRGEAFYIRGSQRADGSGGDLSTEFLAWLGTTQLREVTWVDTSTLTAVVPVDLAAGTHDLVVEGPYGTRGTLAAAYEAVSGLAPLLTVEPFAVPATAFVGNPAEIQVKVKNWGPGDVTNVKALLKRVVDGVANENVPGGPAVQPLLAAGASFYAVYAVTTAAPGTFDFQAKASGTAAATNAYVASDKQYVRLEVVAP